MTTAVDRPATGTPAIAPWRVARELALVEGTRLTRHPALLIGAVISVVMMVAVHFGEAPAWPRVSIGVSVPLVAFGLGAVLAVADMSFRLWRTEDSEAIDVLPASPRVRTAGQLAAATAPVLIAALLEAGYMLYTVTQQPVGNVSWWEVVAGPTVVLVMVTVGLAAGRWLPSPITGTITVLVLIGVSAVLGLVGNLAWLALVPEWDMLSSMEGPPPELAFRPMALHVGYLIAVAGLFVAIALLRGRWRGSTWPIAATAVGLAGVAAVLGSINLQEPTASQVDARLSEYLGSDADYTCEERGSVTYCAYPGYQAWIGEWAAAVEPVLNQLPEDVQSSLEVRQYPQRWMDVLQAGDGIRYGPDFPYLGEDIRTGLWWGRGAGNLQTESYPFGMSLGVAAWGVGLPTTPPVTTVSDPYFSSCDVAGQARGIVAVWLAGQASPTGHQHIHNVFEEYETRFPGRFEEVNGWIGDHQPYAWYRSDFRLAHFRYADQLLHRPQNQVTQLIRRHWETLIDPSTTIGDAETLLELDPIDWTPTDYEPSADERCP